MGGLETLGKCGKMVELGGVYRAQWLAVMMKGIEGLRQKVFMISKKLSFSWLKGYLESKGWNSYSTKPGGGLFGYVGLEVGIC